MMGPPIPPLKRFWLKAPPKGSALSVHWSAGSRSSQLKEPATLLVPPRGVVEIYPPESQLQDGENSYHLWVFKDSGTRLPFGLPWPRSSGADGLKTIPTRFIVEGPASPP